MPRENVHRAAGYIRQSDEKQSNFSPAFQKNKILDYCREENLPLLDMHIFFDGKSAKYWRDRKGLKDLLAAAARKEFDTLVLYRLDRFSRDHDHQIILREQLKYYGVKIVTLDPDEHATGETLVDRIVQMVLAFFAEMELKKITERTHDGLIERYQAGFLPVSRRPLYGYSWEDRTILVDGDERLIPKAVYILKEEIIHEDSTGRLWTEYQVVQYVFELADEGIALRRIAKTLTNLGIPSPDGKNYWSPQTVVSILRHRGYTGKHVANKRKYTYEPGEGWRTEIRSESEWIPLPEGVIVPLVSVECFERVQKKLDTNKQNAPRNNHNPTETLLRSGFVKCLSCGSNLTVHRHLARETVDYKCPAHKQGHRVCPASVTINTKLADEYAWAKAIDVIRDPTLVERELAKRQQPDRLQDEIDNLTRLIEALVPKMKNIMETISESPKGEGRALLVAHLGELQSQKTRFEEERDTLRRRQLYVQEEARKVAEFKVWCANIRPTIETEEVSYQRRRETIEYLGICVRVAPYGQKPRMIAEVNPPDIVSTYGSAF